MATDQDGNSTPVLPSTFQNIQGSPTSSEASRSLGSILVGAFIGYSCANLEAGSTPVMIRRFKKMFDEKIEAR